MKIRGKKIIEMTFKEFKKFEEQIRRKYSGSVLHQICVEIIMKTYSCRFWKRNEYFSNIIKDYFTADATTEFLLGE